LCGLLSQFADFVGNNGKAETVLAGAGSFDGSVEREEVGLFGQVINDFDNLANVIGAVTEDVDDFREDWMAWLVRLRPSVAFSMV